jgi:hypothetical protein
MPIISVMYEYICPVWQDHRAHQIIHVCHIVHAYFIRHVCHTGSVCHVIVSGIGAFQPKDEIHKKHVFTLKYLSSKDVCFP